MELYIKTPQDIYYKITNDYVIKVDLLLNSIRQVKCVPSLYPIGLSILSKDEFDEAYKKLYNILNNKNENTSIHTT